MRRLLLALALLLACSATRAQQQNFPSGSSGSSSPGVFTGSQFDGPYTAWVVNGLSPSAQYTAIGQPGFFTDAADCSMAVPASASKHQVDCIAAYVTSSSTAANAVAGYFQAMATAANVPIWPLNPICADGGFAGVICQVIEVDLNITNADHATTPFGNPIQDGIEINGGGTKKARNAIGINSTSAANRWQNGIAITNWNNFGIYTKGVVAGAHHLHLVPSADDGNVEVYGANAADGAMAWQITNSGVGQFTGGVNFGIQFVSTEGTSTGVATGGTLDSCYPDSTAHALKCSFANSPFETLLGPPSAGTAFASLGTPANGTFRFCPDCTVAATCAGSGTGAFAKRLNGVWVCN